MKECELPKSGLEKSIMEQSNRSMERRTLVAEAVERKNIGIYSGSV